MARTLELEYHRTYNNGNYEASKIGIKVELGVSEIPLEAFNDLLQQMIVLRNMELDYVPPLSSERKRRR